MDQVDTMETHCSILKLQKEREADILDTAIDNKYTKLSINNSCENIEFEPDRALDLISVYQ